MQRRLLWSILWPLAVVVPSVTLGFTVSRQLAQTGDAADPLQALQHVDRAEVELEDGTQLLIEVVRDTGNDPPAAKP